MASPGVVADSNGFFHPVGDHAQTQFSIDNQPVTDQQSRIYSNQISPDAVQSMEVITGVAPGRVRRQEQPRRAHRHQVRARPAEADRHGIGRLWIVHEPDLRRQRRRRVALGRQLPVGHRARDRSLSSTRRSSRRFTITGTTSRSSIAWTRTRARPRRFISTSRRRARRSTCRTPTIRTIVGQNQHQQIDTFNIAPGYSQVIGRQQPVHGQLLRPPRSPDLHAERGSLRRHARQRLAEPPSDQHRRQGRLAHTVGGHNIKVGVSIAATKLDEQFTLGLTDPTVNSPCLFADGSPSDDTGLTSPSQCAGA